MTDWCGDVGETAVTSSAPPLGCELVRRRTVTPSRIADALTLLGACAGTILAALYGIGVL